jgi:hypothetical protein
MAILLGIIGTTLFLVCIFGLVIVEDAWQLGGEFYINGNYGRRKMWIERLLDGFEIIGRM